MSKVKFIRQINEREYCTEVNFGIPFQLSRLERGKIQEYLSPSIFSVEPYKKLSAHGIVSVSGVYNPFKIYL